MSKNDKNNAPKKNIGVIALVWIMAILMVGGIVASTVYALVQSF